MLPVASQHEGVAVAPEPLGGDAAAEIVQLHQLAELLAVGAGRDDPVPGLVIGHVQGLGARDLVPRVAPVVLQVAAAALLLLPHEGEVRDIAPHVGGHGMHPHEARTVQTVDVARGADMLGQEHLGGAALGLGLGHAALGGLAVEMGHHVAVLLGHGAQMVAHGDVHRRAHHLHEHGRIGEQAGLDVLAQVFLDQRIEHHPPREERARKDDEKSGEYLGANAHDVVVWSRRACGQPRPVRALPVMYTTI